MIKSDKLKTGDIGEELAAKFLTKKGYVVVERNFRYKRSEIDIIAEFQNTLVFVEVKTRSHTDFGFPEEFVGIKKYKQLSLAAEFYLQQKNWINLVRFDVISITLKPNIQIEHFEDLTF